MSTVPVGTDQPLIQTGAHIGHDGWCFLSSGSRSQQLISRIAHMLARVITDIRLVLFLLFNPIPSWSFLPPFPFPLLSPPHPSLLLLLSGEQKGEIVCECQDSRLCTLAPPPRYMVRSAISHVHFLGVADWFLCWLCADVRKRVGRKFVVGGKIVVLQGGVSPVNVALSVGRGEVYEAILKSTYL